MKLDFDSERRAGEVAVHLVASGYKIIFYTEVDTTAIMDKIKFVIEIQN